MARQGLLLVNLGTPDAPTAAAVRPYLRQFLLDGRVIDLPALPRWLLVHLAILPRRPRASAHAYRQIWTDRGSPLLFHSLDLAEAVAARLGDGYAVALGMRYGNPSLGAALARLRGLGVEALTVLPLYPQYAASSTGSSVAELYRLLGQAWDPLRVRVLPEFYEDEGFLDAFAEVARAQAQAVDHVLFSFHGLPERQLRKSDPDGSRCLKAASCCEAITAANRRCYRAQSHATARGLAQRLGLDASRYTVSFQSRLGRTPWIKPYTDEVLPTLPSRGIKRLAVVCPSFVADCLETVEEIGLRARAQFLEAGGKAFERIPCLNATPRWVEAVVRMVRDA